MIAELNGVECSVVVCTYNPKWEKLRLTLKSILMQEDCNVQIVITDDGSEINYFKKVRNFFAGYAFCNYKLMTNYENQGTVKNILKGVRACIGEFVKPISPGDFLHGKHALRHWIDFMRNNDDYVMSYCDAVYYKWIGMKLTILKMKASPQSREPNLKQYLVYRDLCLGASVMVQRNKWIQYLEMICDKVIYAEDFSYQLMMYQGEKIKNIPETLLLYEYGSGVSTCNMSFWTEKMRNDYKIMNDILISAEPCREAKQLNLIDYLQIPADNTWGNKWKRIVFCPSKIVFRIKHRFFSRKTSVNFNKDFVADLLNMK